MRTPTKARSTTIKTIIAGLGIALLSACSGSPTAPTNSAAKVATPGARSNFSGYVVAENDTTGQHIVNMGGQLIRRIPLDSLGSQQ